MQINQFVNTVLATGEGTGAVSWLNYAFRLMYLPIGLFGVSIATAAVPAIATLAVNDDKAGMRRTISSGLRLMLMLNVPATIGLIALAGPMVSLIFERGSFGPADTPATAAALMCYAPGLLGYSVVKIASPTFYALRDSRTPVIVSVVSVFVNVVLNLALVRVLGYRGLALGTAMAALVNAGTLLWLLRGRLGGLDERRVITSFMKILCASLVMAAAAAGLHTWLGSVWPDARFFARAVRLASAIGVGLAALAVSARLFRINEFVDATRAVTARLSRRRASSSLPGR